MTGGSTKSARFPGVFRSALRGNVLFLGMVSLLTDLSSEMIYPLLPVFLAGIAPAGLAAFYVGLMEGIAESTASLVKIAAGMASDRAGRRKAFAMLGYGISTIARPFMAAAAAGWHVVALRFLDRIGKGIRASPRDALLSDAADPESRATAFGFHRAMDHAGAVMGPISAAVFLYIMIGRALWQGHGQVATEVEMRAMRWLFAMALVPGLAAFGVLAVTVKDSPMARTAAAGRAGPIAGSAGGPLPGGFYWFLAAVTVFALGNSSDLFLVFYAKTRFGLGLAHVLAIWVGLHMFKALFNLAGGALADRIGRRRCILAGWSLYACVYAAMPAAAGPGWFWALMIVYGAYYGLTEGAEKALVAGLVPKDRRGRAFGLYHAAVGIAALPASALFGTFWAALGPSRAFGIGAGFACTAAVLLAAQPKLSS